MNHKLQSFITFIMSELLRQSDMEIVGRLLGQLSDTDMVIM